MSYLSLSLLGSFEATLDSKSLKKFRTNKTQALFIYLAAEPTASHQRDDLMALLWPGLPHKSAQVNLRQTIYRLRKAIPDWTEHAGGDAVSLLLTGYRTVGLNPAYPLEVDTNSFKDLLSEAQTHEHSHLLTCEPCLELLDRAAGLHRGSFLADFWLDDSDLFEDWALAKRESTRRQVLDALETLTTAALRSGSY